MPAMRGASMSLMIGTLTAPLALIPPIELPVPLT
jgi:hypothetical protein